MKKLFIFLITALYLISGTELREITKLPVLFQHYFEHKSLDSKITFTEYLTDHYNSIPHTDNDEARDNQLPFKTVDLTGMFIPAIPVSQTHYIRKAEQPISTNDSSLYIESLIPTPQHGSVWRRNKAFSIYRKPYSYAKPSHVVA